MGIWMRAGKHCWPDWATYGCWRSSDGIAARCIFSRVCWRSSDSTTAHCILVESVTSPQCCFRISLGWHLHFTLREETIQHWKKYLTWMWTWVQAWKIQAEANDELERLLQSSPLLPESTWSSKALFSTLTSHWGWLYADVGLVILLQETCLEHHVRDWIIFSNPISPRGQSIIESKKPICFYCCLQMLETKFEMTFKAEMISLISSCCSVLACLLCQENSLCDDVLLLFVPMHFFFVHGFSKHLNWEEMVMILIWNHFSLADLWNTCWWWHNFCKFYSNKMKLCFVYMPGARCQVPGDVCNIPCQHAPTLWAMTFISLHVVFAATIVVNMCISSKSVNSCVTRIFVYALKDIIHTPYYPSIFIFWEWSKVYNKIFSALSIHVQYNSITYCTREEGGIPKNTTGWIVNHGLNHHH